MNLRYLAAAAVLTLAGTVIVGVGEAAQGTDQTVQVKDFSFQSSTGSMSVTVGVGQSVNWSFIDPVDHTTTSNQKFWKSPRQEVGSKPFTYTFVGAGVYPYHCAIHTYMTGTVAVPMTVTGTPAAGYHLTWASRAHVDTVDVQQRRKGTSRWVAVATASSGTGGTFNPAKAGSYDLRARSHNAGHTSSWTKPRSLTIS